MTTESKHVRIDAHQHFWKYSPSEYPWIGSGMERLAKNYLPSDLQELATPCGISGSVAVQARQSIQESHWLLGLAEKTDFIKGVVGWVDLRSEHVVNDLTDLAQHKKFVGVRHVVQDEPDPQFLLGEAFVSGLKHLHNWGLTYDLLLYPPQLVVATQLVGRMPDQFFVLDHLAKPRIKKNEIKQWSSDLNALARYDNVYCKLSGLVTEADWQSWSVKDLKPYLDVALKAFGAERLMFGSDWPVCLLAGEYADVIGVVEDFLKSLSQDEQQRIWGQTAKHFYGLS